MRLRLKRIIAIQLKLCAYVDWSELQSKFRKFEVLGNKDYISKYQKFYL